MHFNPESEELRQDWESFITAIPESEVYQSELPLTSIASGDRVLIKTRNTRYLFTWESPDWAELTSTNAKAPSGLVRIMGCSFGLSSSIRPDAFFCGGNLEFTHAEGEKTWTTSPIEEIHLLHRSPDPTTEKSS